MYIYVSIGFSHNHILLSLSLLTEGNGGSIVKEFIVTSLNWYGGLVDSVVAKKLMCFGANGMSVFQGSKSSVTQQLKEHDAPFMLEVHYMAHCTN